jgi:flagellar biogenesis protein FliO
MNFRKSTLLLITCLMPLITQAAPAPATSLKNNPTLDPTPAPSPAQPAPVQPAQVPGQPAPANPFDTSDKVEPPTYEYALGKMLLTLLGLIMLIVLTVWMLRKLGGGKMGGASSQAIKIIERRPLSQKSVLYLIEVQGKKVLIAESQLEVRRLTDIDTLPKD